MPLFLLANPTGDSRAMYLARKVLAPVNLCPLEVYRALHVHLPSKFSRRVDGETSFAPSRLAGNRTKLPRGCRINNKAEEKVDRGYRAETRKVCSTFARNSQVSSHVESIAPFFSPTSCGFRISVHFSQFTERRTTSRKMRIGGRSRVRLVSTTEIRAREREEIDAVVVSIARRSRVTLERSFIPRALLSAV